MHAHCIARRDCDAANGLSMRCLGLMCATLGLTLLLPACGSIAPERAGVAVRTSVEVQLLALNDFHGHLESPLSDAAARGGVARLGTLVRQQKAANPHSIVVAAGDLVGASPLLSSSFHDEPTIEALSTLGLELSAVGNHEFDEGLAELRRLQQGGCHPQSACKGPAPFTGAGFQYLAANVIDDTSGESVFPARVVREFDGIPVGFIGLTLADTPSLLIPAHRAGLQFLDEAETVNREVETLLADGIEAIVVLIHEGGMLTAGDCAGLTGPITEIVPRLHAEVDLIVSGHTHNAYACTIDRRLVTSAGQYGTQLTAITLTLDRGTGDVTLARAVTLPVGNELAEDPALAKLVQEYQLRAAPLVQREVGVIGAPMGRAPDAAGESVMGAAIADAMLAAAQHGTGEAIAVAFMNPGGVRGGLAAGPVTYADLFTVQPFGNTLTVLTLSGAQIETLLREQFTNSPRRILHVSAGFSYRWRGGADAELVPGSIRIAGEPLRPERRYRIVTNNFLAEGGDGFTTFTAGTEPTPAGVDAEALEAWIARDAVFVPPELGRIVLEPQP